MRPCHPALIEIFGSKLKVSFVNRKKLEQRIASVYVVGSNSEEITNKRVSQIELLMLDDSRLGKCVLFPKVNMLYPEIRPESCVVLSETVGAVSTSSTRASTPLQGGYPHLEG